MYITVYLCIQLLNTDVNALSDRDRNTLTCNDIAGVTLKNVTLKNEFGDHKKDVHVSICLLVY